MIIIRDNSHSSVIRPNTLQIFLFLSLASFLTAQTARAEAPEQHALANVELEYTYSDGGAVILKVDEGKLGYVWTAGPSAGYEVTDRIYRSRKIAADIYLINWHDPENKDYVNLVIDFENLVVHGSALAAYDNESPFAFFDKAEISRVTWLEK